MTDSIFFSACTVKSANKLLITNSPGRMSMSMLGPTLGCGDLSLCAPQGNKLPLFEFVNVVLVVLMLSLASGS